MTDYEVAGPAIELANEFSYVVVDHVIVGNGSRLRIRSPRGGSEILLDPVALESLTLQQPETFSILLANASAQLDSS